MKTILFFDTETTGLFDFKKPVTDPSQPRICEIAAVLEEEESGIEIASLSFILRPDGYSIPDSVAMIHGISHDMAMECGVLAKGAIFAFIDLVNIADVVCAHNLKFDADMLAREIDCLKMSRPFQPKAGFCTMLRAKEVMRVSKWPKLSEAYQHFYGKEFEGAHRAINDVRCCSQVYRGIRQAKGGKDAG